MFQKYGLPLIALGMLCFAVYHVVKAQHVPPKLQPPVQPARSPFSKGVAAAGIVEPKTENIILGTNLPGIVFKVHVKVNQKVKKGEVLFELDPRQLKAELRVREQARNAAKSQVAKLEAMPRPEEVPAYKARLDEAKELLADREDQMLRIRRLYTGRVSSDEDRVRTEQAARVAREQVKRAEADLKLIKAGAWKPDVDIAAANLAQNEALVEQTKTELARLQVTAPVDGTILQVNVRKGEYVNTQSGTALMVMGNIEQLHVRVDVDEYDIPRFDRNAPARATLRGDPRKEYELTLVHIEPYVVPKKSLTGDNTERVDTRVLQAIYAVKSGSPGLFVGQQVDVYIDRTAEKK